MNWNISYKYVYKSSWFASGEIEYIEGKSILNMQWSFKLFKEFDKILSNTYLIKQNSFVSEF